MAGGGLSKPLGSGKRGKKGRVGEEGPARAQDIVPVTPGGAARQSCRAIACGATGVPTSPACVARRNPPANVARLSRHPYWRDRG